MLSHKLAIGLAYALAAGVTICTVIVSVKWGLRDSAKFIFPTVALIFAACAIHAGLRNK